jgi:L-ribulose-5-phosphate 4-epimerase
MQLEAVRAKVLEIAKKASKEGLMRLTMGNFSIRDQETGLVAITPTTRPYETMTAADICLVDINEKPVDCPFKPSYETPMHCYIYRNRPDVNGVVHTHSPYCNAFGLVGRAIPPVTVNMIDIGTVNAAPFCSSGTEEFGQRAMAAMGQGEAVILGNHGLLAIGPDLEKAFATAVFVEDGATVYYRALSLGTPFTLSDCTHGEG